jgi:hypothetical protein
MISTQTIEIHLLFQFVSIQKLHNLTAATHDLMAALRHLSMHSCCLFSYVSVPQPDGCITSCSDAQPDGCITPCFDAQLTRTSLQMSANCESTAIQRWNTYRDWARVRGVAGLTCHGIIGNTKQTKQNTNVVNIAISA